ncbi:hypothetical protein [Ruegeria atlantica]|uniref:hypothetical protein n=1 Tax=Ruegeria atlantica TaxID=81569 RepID=UPI001480D350|nr:hypothetical protein [Ruegeria atlantica]
MLTRIFLQYRRFFLCCILLSVFFYLATLLGYGEWPEDVRGPLAPLAYIITIAICIGTPIIVFSLLATFMLPLMEIWLVSLIVLMLVFTPMRALLPADSIPGWVDCIALGALSILTYLAVYGSWFGGIMKKHMKKHTKTFHLTGDPEDIWNAFFPNPENPDRYYWPNTQFLPPPNGSKASFVMTLPRRGDLENMTQKVFIEYAQPFSEFRFSTRSLPGCSDPNQIVEVKITPTGTKCQVEYTRQLIDVPIGKRLFLYLSNDFRDTVHSMKRRFSGRRDGSLQGRQMLRG